MERQGERPLEDPGGAGEGALVPVGAEERQRVGADLGLDPLRAQGRQDAVAVVARCFRQTLEIFQRAAEGKRGEEALHAIGEAYGELLASDRIYLRAQMQAYAACEDGDICAVVRGGFGDLVNYVERVSGVEPDALSDFFSQGMLLNVLASMDAPAEDWGARLVEGCNNK